MGAMVPPPHPAANLRRCSVPTYDEGFRYSDRLAYGRWQAPARSADDVWRGFPEWFTDPTDPVRDAIGAGLAAVFNQVASAGARSMVSHLRAHATGWRLDLVAAGVGVARGGGELDHELRARVAIVEDVVSADAVRAAVDAVLPGVTVIYPARHGLYLGRGFLGRAPIDWRATRAAADGRYRLADVGPVRLWSRVAARFHLLLPAVGAAAYLGPTATPSARRVWLSRSLSGVRSYLSSPANAARRRTLAQAAERVRASGVRWTATFASPA